MAILITDSDFEQRVLVHAAQNSIPTNKKALVVAVADAAMRAAEHRGVSIGRIIEELQGEAVLPARTFVQPTLPITTRSVDGE